jgi:hypothetical protein
MIGSFAVFCCWGTRANARTDGSHNLKQEAEKEKRAMILERLRSLLKLVFEHEKLHPETSIAIGTQIYLNMGVLCS